MRTIRSAKSKAKRKKKELTPKQILGKQSKIKGYINENRSVAYIMANQEKYGVSDKVYIYCTPRLGNKHTPDLFSVKYFENNGDCKFAGWDIVALGKRKTILVQVKSTRKPSLRYIDALSSFGVDIENLIKELHIWTDDAENPLQIINLNLK